MFEPGSLVKLKSGSPDMCIAGESDDRTGWIECIWYDGGEALRDSFPPYCLVVVRAADGEAKPIAHKPATVRPGDPPAGAPDPDPEPPPADAVHVNTANGRVTFKGKVCTLSGSGLTVVQCTAPAMPDPVDRADIKAAIWPDGPGPSADSQLSTTITWANQRLSSIGLVLKTIRGRGVALQEIGQG
jgi:uncharacterized protein YodC (DUF2158 family)